MQSSHHNLNFCKGEYTTCVPQLRNEAKRMYARDTYVHMYGRVSLKIE